MQEKREQEQKDVLEFEYNLETYSDNSGESEDELDSEHVPQLTVGGAPQHKSMSKTDQTERFSPLMSENSAANFVGLAPGPMAVACYTV